MKTAVSNRGAGYRTYEPVINSYWTVWGCVSTCGSFWVPIDDTQYKTKEEAIEKAKEIGEYMEMGR